MTVEQKAKRFCKDFVFTYIIPSYNQTKRKSDALIAEESFIAGYNECEKDTVHTDNTETLNNALKRIEELEQENARLKLELEALDGQIPWKDIKDKSEVLGKLTEAKDIINCLVHLGDFNENTDEEYLNYQVHDVLKQAENFLKG